MTAAVRPTAAAARRAGSPPGTPADEAARLVALHDCGVLDTEPEAGFDDLAGIAALLCDAPIALVSLVDARRQWFKAKVGLAVAETPRDVSFCGHAILRPRDLLVVDDATADPRFADNPLVTGEPGIRFYAGAPLLSREGHALGTLCVIDRRPRTLDGARRGALQALARQVALQLELRRALAEATRESLTDALTETANRRGFEARLARHWERAAGRVPSPPLALLRLEIDAFDDFVATFGAPAGDALLRDVARLARHAMPLADPLARLEGPSFAVLRDGADLADVMPAARELCRAVAASRLWGRPVTLSVGAAVERPDVGGDPSLLVLRAEAAMRSARARGGHGVAAAPGI